MCLSSDHMTGRGAQRSACSGLREAFVYRSPGDKLLLGTLMSFQLPLPKSKLCYGSLYHPNDNLEQVFSTLGIFNCLTRSWRRVCHTRPVLRRKPACPRLVLTTHDVMLAPSRWLHFGHLCFSSGSWCESRTCPPPWHTQGIRWPLAPTTPHTAAAQPITVPYQVTLLQSPEVRNTSRWLPTTCLEKLRIAKEHITQEIPGSWESAHTLFYSTFI